MQAMPLTEEQREQIETQREAALERKRRRLNDEHLLQKGEWSKEDLQMKFAPPASADSEPVVIASAPGIDESAPADSEPVAIASAPGIEAAPADVVPVVIASVSGCPEYYHKESTLSYWWRKSGHTFPWNSMVCLFDILHRERLQQEQRQQQQNWDRFQ